LPEPEQATTRKLRLYNYLSPFGRAAGRWMHAQADRDVQAAIEHDYTSHIIQAIGRLRAGLRPVSLPPVRVLILCNEPVAGLKIDCLTTVKDMTRTNPTEKENFLYISHEKSVEKGRLVLEPSACQAPAPSTASATWDRELVQDETTATQFADLWLVTDPLPAPESVGKAGPAPGDNVELDYAAYKILLAEAKQTFAWQLVDWIACQAEASRDLSSPEKRTISLLVKDARQYIRALGIIARLVPHHVAG
jgi:hypothetical protein